MNYNSSEEIVITGADLENAENPNRPEQPQTDETCEFIIGTEKQQPQPREDVYEFTLDEESAVINGEKSTSGMVNISLPEEDKLNVQAKNKSTTSCAAHQNNSSESLPSVKPASVQQTSKPASNTRTSEIQKKRKPQAAAQPAKNKKKPQNSQPSKTAKKQKEGRASASTQPDKKIEKSEKTEKSCLAIISLVLGITSVLLLGIVWGVAGIVLSAISLKKKKSRKIAFAGLIVSCVGILASAVAMLLVFLF